MYRRILVAVDGSPTSGAALEEAVKLAQDQKAALRLVHVVDETIAYVTLDSPQLIASHRAQLREDGNRVLAAAAGTTRAAGVAAETKLAVLDRIDHRVCDAIEAEAEAWPADLVVIGTHGRRGVRHLVLGSVAEGLVRIATKPVLLVRSP
jgi:nucleotide-binding universal stress UspA family protein